MLNRDEDRFVIEELRTSVSTVREIVDILLLARASHKFGSSYSPRGLMNLRTQLTATVEAKRHEV